MQQRPAPFSAHTVCPLDLQCAGPILYAAAPRPMQRQHGLQRRGKALALRLPLRWQLTVTVSSTSSTMTFRSLPQRFYLATGPRQDLSVAGEDPFSTQRPAILPPMALQYAAVRSRWCLSNPCACPVRACMEPMCGIDSIYCAHATSTLKYRPCTLKIPLTGCLPLDFTAHSTR